MLIDKWWLMSVTPISAEPAAHQQSMSLKRNTLWNLAGTAIPMAAGLALIPYTLDRLGSEAFGVLTLVWGSLATSACSIWVWGVR
ncbi:hypothetical protein HZ993_12055 [Rhodoferax sp. AJA081-3]|uniref:hypothetical protein n=1 Tax=Rhodoferax sp. AJA081-3 TaxID=2752316 RepID=UPI001ADFD5FA|nr:hypothetical protein [Rhodoferax sp. AJA081-3]QTN30422.1 hypothetical protein HZ993_12055 [Rhodoferax sp. AJA081-3]